MTTYISALKPHISWFLEELKKRKDGEEIGFKMVDLKKEMGKEFVDKHPRSFYINVKDILLENGIKLRQYTNNDEIQYYLSLAKPEEVMSARDIHWKRSTKTAKNYGFETYKEYWNKHQYKKSNRTPYNENKECSQYFGRYIEEKYVIQIFEDIKEFEYPTDNIGRITNTHKPYDWICKNNKKIKHTASCIRSDIHHMYKDGTPMPYVAYAIKRNSSPDYWILSAWDNRESLTPMYVWMVPGHEKFWTQASYNEFYKRDSFIVYLNKKGILRMHKYELENKIEELKSICNIVKFKAIEDINKDNFVDEKDIIKLKI